MGIQGTSTAQLGTLGAGWVTGYFSSQRQRDEFQSWPTGREGAGAERSEVVRAESRRECDTVCYICSPTRGVKRTQQKAFGEIETRRRSPIGRWAGLSCALGGGNGPDERLGAMTACEKLRRQKAKSGQRRLSRRCRCTRWRRRCRRVVTR